MTIQVNITSMTANTPVDVYYCDAMSSSCVFVSGVTVFPFSFEVPPPYTEENIIIKIEDSEGCIEAQTIAISPTPTSSVTPTVTPTPSITPTTSVTPTVTPTNSPTASLTPTMTPTVTPSVTTTPVAASHFVGMNEYTTSAQTCSDILSLSSYYTYISESFLVPVINATVYLTLVNGVLYNPYNGNNKWRLMSFGGNNYAVQIDSFGKIIDFAGC